MSSAAYSRVAVGLCTLCVWFGSTSARAQSTAPAAGTPLSYRQQPAILFANQTDNIEVSVEVLGDVDTVTFRRNVPTLSGGFTTERWARQTTRSIDGRLVSVFGASYESEILVDLMVYPHGNDFPQVPLGRLVVPGRDDDPSIVWLRVAPSNLPESPVLRLGPEVQYASHVVNLVVPGFGDTRMLGDLETFAVEHAAAIFYQHFSDAYETLAFVPVVSPFLEDDGLHVNVWNDIAGIGMEQFDHRADFGSGLLRSIQIYPAGFLGHQATLLHQLGHQWGDESVLGRIAGVALAGHDPERHTPLMDGGATLLGAVLPGTRAVEFLGGIPQIVRADGPLGYHPLQQYRMGLLEVDAIPDVRVFAEQSQFGEDVSVPAVGTAVNGSWQTVGVNDLLASLGTRDGPVFEGWRQAFVVISGELVSQREMDFFNFYARRAGTARGTRSVDGFGSFAEATGGAMTISTAVLPLTDAPQTPVGDVADAPFGTRDWRGLVFDQPFPSVLDAGSTVTLTGSLDQDTLPGSYRFLSLRLGRYGDPTSDALTVQTTISGGRFTLPVSVVGAPAGAYRVELFVYDGASGPALHAGSLTPLRVR